MEEIWKDVENYEGIYQVSNTGKVKSLRFGKERILKFGKSQGYSQINLYKDKKFKKVFIHRLVASTFIENINNLSQVNHIDENKLNNNINNLEWCDSKYNIRYGTGRMRSAEKRSKEVIQILNEIEIARFKSTSEASRQLGINQGNISNCCSGKCKSSCGYQWRYIE